MNRERILVVEDEESIRFVLSSFLTEMGCEVVEAGSVEEALPLLEGLPFSVALLDIVLPGMTGLEMLKMLKEDFPDTEVIIMTSNGSLDTATQAIRAGAYDYLIKPFEEIDDVWDGIKRALDKRNLSLKNRELLRDLELGNRELSIAIKRRDSLIESGRAMSSIHGLSELLDYFIGLVVDELEVDRASIMLVDAQSDLLAIAASRGIPDDIVKQVRVKIGEGISGKVVQTGEPMLVEDAKTDPKCTGKARSDLSSSFISAPIIVSIPIKGREKVLGTINITERRSGEPFDNDDVGYIQGLAGQLAIAIERARHVAALETAIEKLEEAQDQMLVLERLKALGEMAAGVAHDFNNTLNGILMRTQALLVKSRDSDADLADFPKDLEAIEKLSLQGAETIKRIQDFTRIRKDRPQELVDLNAMVRNAVEMTRPHWEQMYEASGCQIEVVLDLGDVPLTLGTPTELTQAISNLIFNAAEAMTDGGRLSIKTSREEEWVRMDVDDTGIGMTKDVRDRIFDPFFSTKEKGQGLGTSIVYGIVKRHGGEITIRSEQGEGTTVTVRIPAHQGDSMPHTQAQKAGERRSIKGRRSGRILVIDDEEHNREVYQSILEDEGYEVFAAAEGKEGLALFAEQAIDVVITDLSMPNMSGWDVAKRVKSLNPDVPVILLSGWAVQQDESQAIEAGVDHVLSKPCSLEDLLNAVGMALEERSAA